MRLQLWNVRGKTTTIHPPPLPPSPPHHHTSLPSQHKEGLLLPHAPSSSMTDDSIKSVKTWLSSEVTVTFTDQRLVNVGGRSQHHYTLAFLTLHSHNRLFNVFSHFTMDFRVQVHKPVNILTVTATYLYKYFGPYNK